VGGTMESAIRILSLKEKYKICYILLVSSIMIDQRFQSLFLYGFDPIQLNANACQHGD